MWLEIPLLTGSDLDSGKTTTHDNRKSCDPLYCITLQNHMIISKPVIGHCYHFLSDNVVHVQTGSHVIHCIAAFFWPVIGHYHLFLSHDPGLYIMRLHGSWIKCSIASREYTSKLSIIHWLYLIVMYMYQTT